MVPVIRIDEQVLQALRLRAMEEGLQFEPLNATIRVVLGLPPGKAHARVPSPFGRGEWGGPVRRRCRRRFVEVAQEKYAAGRSDAEGFIAELWGGIRESAARSGKGQHIVERATVALLRLSEENERMPVPGKRILEKAGIAPNQTSSHGMWIWLCAGVVREVRARNGTRQYVIPEDDHYRGLLKVVLGSGRAG